MVTFGERLEIFWLLFISISGHTGLIPNRSENNLILNKQFTHTNSERQATITEWLLEADELKNLFEVPNHNLVVTTLVMAIIGSHNAHGTCPRAHKRSPS